jgi:hypothetical protein
MKLQSDNHPLRVKGQAQHIGQVPAKDTDNDTNINQSINADLSVSSQRLRG